jgi:hypothetical protein
MFGMQTGFSFVNIDRSNTTGEVASTGMGGFRDAPVAGGWVTKLVALVSSVRPTPLAAAAFRLSTGGLFFAGTFAAIPGAVVAGAFRKSCVFMPAPAFISPDLSVLSRWGTF